MMTFTEEQIEHIKFVMSPWMREADIKAAITELTRPQPEFRDGEVVYVDGQYLRNLPDTKARGNSRKLRLPEMPEAVERLRKFVDWVAAQGSLLSNQQADYEIIIEAAILELVDFDREIEP